MSIVQMRHKGTGNLVLVNPDECDAEWYEPVREEPVSDDNGQDEAPDATPEPYPTDDAGAGEASPVDGQPTVSVPPDGDEEPEAPLAAILAGNIGTVAEYVNSEESIPDLEELLALEFLDEPNEWESGGHKQRVGAKRKGVRDLVKERLKELS